MKKCILLTSIMFFLVLVSNVFGQSDYSDQKNVVVKNYYLSNSVIVKYQKGDCSGIGSWQAYFDFEFLQPGEYEINFVSPKDKQSEYPDNFTVIVGDKAINVVKYKKVNCQPLDATVIIKRKSNGKTDIEKQHFFDPITG